MAALARVRCPSCCAMYCVRHMLGRQCEGWHLGAAGTALNDRPATSGGGARARARPSALDWRAEAAW
eukprot:43251-Chlamydomonas_euryale.AAC.9